MKRALVLCGGGSRGAYEVGVYHALKEAGYTFDIIVGTSIGAINGMLIAQGMDKEMDEIWNNITIDQVMVDGITLETDINAMMEQRSQLLKFIQSFPEQGGANTSPLHDMIRKYAKPQLIRDSGITYGCVTVQYPSLEPVTITLDQMKDDEEFINYIIATSSCWPAFPVHKFDGKQFIDGGYYDNMPIQFAWELGADEIVAISLNDHRIIHPEFTNHPFVKYIQPVVDTGTILQFKPELIERLIRQGYLEAKRALGEYKGNTYTFEHVSPETVDKIARKFYQHVHHLDFYLTQIERKIWPHPQTKFIDMVNRQLPYHGSKEEWVIQLVENAAKLFGINNEEIYNFDELVETLVKMYLETIPVLKETLGDSISFDTVSRMKEMITSWDQKFLVCFMVEYLKSKPNFGNMFNLAMTTFPASFMVAIMMYSLTNDEPLFTKIEKGEPVAKD